MKAALFVCLLVLAVPCVAAAGETPTPAVSACKAEYVQLGADRFAAKYGAGDAGIRACVAAHGGTATAPTPVASGPEAECKAEYVRIGADAFKAKYGANEAFGACVKAAAGGDREKTAKAPPANDVVAVLARSLCSAKLKTAAKDGDGKERFAACVKAVLPKLRELVSRCKSSSGDDRAAFKQCLADAVKTVRVSRRS